MKDIARQISLILCVGGVCSLVLSYSYQTQWHESQYEQNFLLEHKIEAINEEVKPKHGDMYLFHGKAECLSQAETLQGDGNVSSYENLAANTKELDESLIRQSILQKRADKKSEWKNEQYEANIFTSQKPHIGHNVLDEWEIAPLDTGFFQTYYQEVDDLTRQEVKAALKIGSEYTGLGIQSQSVNDPENTNVLLHYLDPITKPDGKESYLLSEGIQSVDSIMDQLKEASNATYGQQWYLMVVGVILIVASLPFGIYGCL